MRLLRHPPAPEEKPPLTSCPYCASSFVQPQGWKELPGGDLLLHLRCPECRVWMIGNFGHDRVAAYDEALVKGREAVVADYEELVRHNMEELAGNFERALEDDLIGPEDFARGISRL
jgi:hypothetical protein